MTRILFLPALVLTLPLRAQFDNMVTTDDGGTLLFQSQWRLAGSIDGNVPKVFRCDSSGFAPVFSPPNPGSFRPLQRPAP